MKLKRVLAGLFTLSLLGAFTYRWMLPTGLAQAPDITVSTIRGEKIPLSQLRGRPVLVNFWSTTCTGCIEEMPHLVALYKELAPKGFELIAIAMPYDPPNRVIAVSKARELPYPVALDIQGDATHAFGDVQLTPSSFLIAPNGRVVHQKTGELDMPKLRAMIVGLLAQPEVPITVSQN